MVAQIRPAQKQDYEVLMKMYDDLTGLRGKYTSWDADSFLEILQTPTSFIDVAERSEKPAGFIAYSTRRVIRYRNPVVNIEEFYVEPDERRKGLGRDLVLHVLEYAKANEAEFVYASADMNQEEAQSFFRALNFSQYGLYYRRSP